MRKKIKAIFITSVHVAPDNLFEFTGFLPYKVFSPKKGTVDGKPIIEDEIINYGLFQYSPLNLKLDRKLVLMLGVSSNLYRADIKTAAEIATVSFLLKVPFKSMINNQVALLLAQDYFERITGGKVPYVERNIILKTTKLYNKEIV